MVRFRRHDLSPRVEMVPLIDVIFLLLTFFVYSLMVMVRADVLPVKLESIAGGEKARPTTVHAITVDAAGRLYWDREPIAATELDAKLTELAATPDAPKLYIALQESLAQPAAAAPEGSTAATPVDRAPLLLSLVQRLRAAGVADFSFVGPPAQGRAR